MLHVCIHSISPHLCWLIWNQVTPNRRRANQSIFWKFREGGKTYRYILCLQKVRQFFGHDPFCYKLIYSKYLHHSVPLHFVIKLNEKLCYKSWKRVNYRTWQSEFWLDWLDFWTVLLLCQYLLKSENSGNSFEMIRIRGQFSLPLVIIWTWTKASTWQTNAAHPLPK